MTKITSYLKLLRPVQWLKNLMLLFPPFLGGTIFNEGLFLAILLPLSSFCFASSATYIINDIVDCTADMEHPVKRFRPLPSGEVVVGKALMLAGLLLISALFLAISVSVKFLILLLAYLAVSLSYTFIFKNYPLFDLFSIASGFILRLLAGGEAFGVAISEWLFLTVFLLALFLSTGKRYSEKKALGEHAEFHRKALAAYPTGFLDGVLSMTGSAVLVTYTMYVISRHSSLLIYTVPLCCFGLFRYILRVQTGKGGDPTESLTRDLPLLIVGIMWAVMVGWGIYAR
ncbi:MAG: decaprenyl-phosphate phosphoribosyltransferase [Geobacteraceae bacterium]|nr:decaprenyl-phosphate phosphoribosyltransferase [Geobacteraceae bacterium]